MRDFLNRDGLAVDHQLGLRAALAAPETAHHSERGAEQGMQATDAALPGAAIRSREHAAGHQDPVALHEDTNLGHFTSLGTVTNASEKNGRIPSFRMSTARLLKPSSSRRRRCSIAA